MNAAKTKWKHNKLYNKGRKDASSLPLNAIMINGVSSTNTINNERNVKKKEKGYQQAEVESFENNLDVFPSKAGTKVGKNKCDAHDRHRNNSGNLNGSSLAKFNSVRLRMDQSKAPTVEGEEFRSNVDPVIVMFQSRCKSRVRFSLEEIHCCTSSNQYSIKNGTNNSDDKENINHMKKTSDRKASCLSALPTPTASTVTTSTMAAKSRREKGGERGGRHNLKNFMKGVLFRSSSRRSEEFEKEADLNDLELGKTSKLLSWKSSHTQSESIDGNEVRHRIQEKLVVSFTENKETRRSVENLLDKARRAQYTHYQYEHAVKYLVKAYDLLTKAQYPDDHPSVTSTLRLLNDAHDALSSYNNSENIVKMGIKYEDSGDLVRALEMYSIAYRIRRDNLSQNHPNLVLLNMLGGIHMKRGDLKEAMKFYQLALKDPTPDPTPDEQNVHRDTPPKKEYSQPFVEPTSKGNLLAKSFTYREMGSIYQRWEEHNKALRMYHRSLHCVAEWKVLNGIYWKNSCQLSTNLTVEGRKLDFYLNRSTINKCSHGNGNYQDNENDGNIINDNSNGSNRTASDNDIGSDSDNDNDGDGAADSDGNGNGDRDGDSNNDSGIDNDNDNHNEKDSGNDKDKDRDKENKSDKEKDDYKVSDQDKNNDDNDYDDENNNNDNDRNKGNGNNNNADKDEDNNNADDNAGKNSNSNDIGKSRGYDSWKCNCNDIDNGTDATNSDDNGHNNCNHKGTLNDFDALKVVQSFPIGSNGMDDDSEKVAMECCDGCNNQLAVSYYESFFPNSLGKETVVRPASEKRLKKRLTEKEMCGRSYDYADIDVALTIHQIAQLHRKQGKFSSALDAYTVSLRGMKYAVGRNHPNVAAILGNIGNLQKEMGDLDAAYNTYQEVLSIESYRLGLDHPDVVITLHNTATIEAARGRYGPALTLYRQVLALQEKLFGKDHGSVAVTVACMGDVYEQIGDMNNALESYEESLRIKSAIQGGHSLEVARMLHKLAKVSFMRNDFTTAYSYILRAILVYRLNKIADDHEWAIDARRDSIDIDAAMAMSRKVTIKC